MICGRLVLNLSLPVSHVFARSRVARGQAVEVGRGWSLTRGVFAGGEVRIALSALLTGGHAGHP